MRDPVAEVLTERTALEGGPAAAIALSLLLHGSVAAAAIFAALQRPAPQIAPSLSIKFAKMPSMTPVEQPGAAAPKPAAPKIEPPRPVPLKPVEAAAAEPPKKNAVPFSPFGRSHQKGSDQLAAPPVPATPASGATSTSGEVAVGDTGVSGLEGGDFPYTLYLDRMRTLIGMRWVRPPVTSPRATVVYFRIQRDGSIVSPDHSAKSGDGLFDRAALRAVVEASPLPPLPPGYSGSYLGVHLTFK